MRRAIAVALAAGLVASAFIVPAEAGKRVKPTTLYLHGHEGEIQEAHLQEMWLDSKWMSMDTKKPSGSSTKSMFVTNYYTGPNTDCDGNGLLPVWKGEYTANFKGNVTVSLHTIATPGAAMTVSLYPNPTGTCTSSTTGSTAPQPAATETLNVAPGQGVTKVTFKNVSFQALGTLALQLSTPRPTPGQTRVLFDSETAPSSVKLQPKK